MRLAALVGGVATIAAAVVLFVIAPMPHLVVAPSPATSVPAILEITGAPDEVTGELLLTTVSLRAATPAHAVFERVDDLWVEHDFEEIQPLRNFLPPDRREREEFFEAQREVFDESVQVAAAVGLRLAGSEDVEVSGDGARVVGVIPGSPADGVLEAGDVIVGVDGQAIELASRLAARSANADAGDELLLTVQRDGGRIEVEVTIGDIPVPEIEEPGIGIYVRTENQEITLPSDVTIENTSSIGGPSAGLMLALTIYDLFDPTDLTRGESIAGTGTIAVDGAVGPIGSVQEKVRGAELADASLFLAPASQVTEAREVAPDRMEVVAVETIEEAVSAIERHVEQRQPGGE